MKHETFHYASLAEAAAEAEKLNVFLPLEEDVSVLFSPLALGKHTAANRIAFQPMEGTDGTPDGAPGELTVRRYRRFAGAGPGLIWFEAVATVPEGRASARQLWLTESNADRFARLVDDIRETAVRRTGFAPLIVMQATNSGRYSKPQGRPAPMIAYRYPHLEQPPLDAGRVVTDAELERFEAAYEKTAALCRRAGFDGMDVKACHRYLACELLSAYTRPGKYGGSYENRTRFLKNCLRAARAGAGDGGFFLTCRLNVYDGYPRPFGFGAAEGGGTEFDPAEPVRLINELRAEFSIPLVNITMGNPYREPHINRPYDHGNYVPPEHPLEGVGRIMRNTALVKKGAGDLPVLGSGYSYLRQFSGNLAAGMIRGGSCDLAGFGRMAFAYPEFIRDLKERGAMDRASCCVACGGCAALLRAGTPAGCVVRDREVYHP